MFSTSPWAAALRLFHCSASPRRRGADRRLVVRIRESASDLTRRTDRAVAGQVTALRRAVQHRKGGPESEVLVSAGAAIAEAVRRVLGLELHETQLLGGLALARGRLAELATGEGKTLAALLPACLHALHGHGVHVMTLNAYLAQRDSELLGPVYRLLGISCGLLAVDANFASKRAAYACDVTYGPGHEFGFDYLRDQTALLSRRQPQLGESFRSRLHGQDSTGQHPLQRGHFAAVVDEADSVLIDEAMTPLVLSQGSEPADDGQDIHLVARKIASGLDAARDYVISRDGSQVRLTERALQQLAAGRTGRPPGRLSRPWPVYVQQALRAEKTLRRDVDYIVTDDQVRIVDQYTGRIFSDRSWRDGLHQAVQAKEQVTVTPETNSVARITRQRFFQLYQHLCGMSGTVRGSERELSRTYGLRVTLVPPHRPCQRITLPMRVFRDGATKLQAIAADVARWQASGRPVLVGTAAIETSVRLAHLLAARQIRHELLNGRQDAPEAAVVAAAGEMGAVTIATNMAGRGTDIKLGSGVAQLGGLHVIAAEPQRSVRVDRQLVGRAARQGDPGSCQHFAAADDSLLRLHHPDLARRIAQAANEAGEIPDARGLAAKIRQVQTRVERAEARTRSQMSAHDEWLESVLGDLTSSPRHD